jgi:hypothetical protein
VSQSFGYIPKSGIAGSNGKSMSSFLSTVCAFKNNFTAGDEIKNLIIFYRNAHVLVCCSTIHKNQDLDST